ncbi:MAG: ABC transporter substrate-binding protein [Bacteroidetes bacterium]|nr:ABC transporter substrate-binding protein [Bacteroidota bacterium]
MNTRTVTDHMGRQLTVPVLPRRIISLCPSQTETLFALGLGERIVGVTHFCIHPRERTTALPKVGGTKKVHAQRVADLQPDLIIAEKEEQTPETVAELSALAPVYVTEALGFADALLGIRDLADLCGVPAAGEALTQEILAAFTGFPLAPLGTAAYFIWRKPWMAAGHPTYINDILARTGLHNVFAYRTDSRYPEVTTEQLQTARPGHILLSSEPYPFADKHIAEFRQLCPEAHIRLVDGEMFSWYGVRLLKAAGYLSALHKELNGYS